MVTSLPFGSTQFINGVPQAPAQLGGSGRSYWDVPSAIAGESETAVAGTTAAGTTNGVVVGSAGFSAVDDFYNGAFVILTDATPANGRAAVWARIIDYVGATRTMVIDTPVDFGGIGENIVVVFPAVVDMNKDQRGNVTINKSCILNLGGCRIVGQLNITAGAFVWIRGGGEITDGIIDSRSVVGMVRMEGISVSERNATLYAFVKTTASNIGAVECVDCEFRGIVAGRQGIARWVVKNCQNHGVVDGSGNVPWRVVEAAGGAVTFSNVDVTIFGPFSGTIFYSDGAGSIASAAPNYLSVFADMSMPLADFQGSLQSPRAFSILCAIGASTPSVVASSGQVAVRGGIVNNSSGADEPFLAIDFALLRARNCTGTATLTLSMTNPVMLDLASFGGMNSCLTVDGATACTGLVTLNGGAQRNINLGNGYFAITLIRGGMAATGSLTVSSGTISTQGGQYVSGIYFIADQASGVPVATVSPILQIQGCYRFDVFGFDTTLSSITTGTWTVAPASATLDGITLLNPAGTIATSGVSGGTWGVNGTWEVNFSAGLGGSVCVAVSLATGGTLDVPGTWGLNGGTHGSVLVNHALSAGSVVSRAGTTFISYMSFINAFAILFAQTATSTVSGAGNVHFSHCDFSGNINFVNSVNTVAYPGSMTFRHCTFFSTCASQVTSGGGVVTGTTSNLEFHHTTVENIFTLVGTRFSIVRADYSDFRGATTAIAFSGTRPGAYFFVKCAFNGQVVNQGQPDILDDIVTVPNNGSAKTAGQLVTINGSGQAADPGSGSIIEGVVYAAVGANNNSTTLIRRGATYVKSDAAVTPVVAGDNCTVDNVTDRTQQAAAVGTVVVGQRVSRAMENASATVAGKAYSVINLM